MPLRKRLQASVAASAGNAEGKKSKRQRLVDFLRLRKKKIPEEEQPSTVYSPVSCYPRSPTYGGLRVTLDVRPVESRMEASISSAAKDNVKTYPSIMTTPL